MLLHHYKLHKIIQAVFGWEDVHLYQFAERGMRPSEDCGAPSGNERLKEIKKNPKDPEHGEMKEWLGIDVDEIYNPKSFDLEEAQKAVKNI